MGFPVANTKTLKNKQTCRYPLSSLMACLLSDSAKGVINENQTYRQRCQKNALSVYWRFHCCFLRTCYKLFLLILQLNSFFLGDAYTYYSRLILLRYVPLYLRCIQQIMALFKEAGLYLLPPRSFPRNRCNVDFPLYLIRKATLPCFHHYPLCNFSCQCINSENYSS